MKLFGNAKITRIRITSAFEQFCNKQSQFGSRQVANVDMYDSYL